MKSKYYNELLEKLKKYPEDKDFYKKELNKFNKNITKFNNKRFYILSELQDKFIVIFFDEKKHETKIAEISKRFSFVNGPHVVLKMNNDTKCMWAKSDEYNIKYDFYKKYFIHDELYFKNTFIVLTCEMLDDINY